MSWNYRIVTKSTDTGESEYGIHEVFYDDKGNVIGMTENLLIPVCGTLEDLSVELSLMMNAFNKDVLKFKVSK